MVGIHPSACESYEEFLKTAIQAFWDRDPDRIDSLALLLASREAWEAGLDRATTRLSLKNLLAGAASAAAITSLVRSVMGGPLGIILAGASAASLIALYNKNSERIRERTQSYRRVVTGFRSGFDEIREDYLADRIRRDQRDLMMEGLYARFIDALEDPSAKVVVEEELAAPVEEEKAVPPEEEKATPLEQEKAPAPDDQQDDRDLN